MVSKVLLCSLDKSLNIGSCLLRIFCEKFTPSHLTVWTVCSKSEATPSIYWSLGESPLFFLWRFGLSNFVSVIIWEQKGLRKRDYLEKCSNPLNTFPRNWFLHDMISWEHLWSNMQLPIFKLTYCIRFKAILQCNIALNLDSGTNNNRKKEEKIFILFSQNSPKMAPMGETYLLFFLSKEPFDFCETSRVQNFI